jgi:hypothetical protein
MTDQRHGNVSAIVNAADPHGIVERSTEGSGLQALDSRDFRLSPFGVCKLTPKRQCSHRRQEPRKKDCSQRQSTRRKRRLVRCARRTEKGCNDKKRSGHRLCQTTAGQERAV